MPRFLTRLIVLFSFAALSACATLPADAPPGTINDPYEGVNRAVHAVNVELDRIALRPASVAYMAVAPDPVRAGISNVADTLGTPQTIVNQVLQGRFGRAARNTLRFTTNATIGLGGLFDPASSVGLTEDQSGFGETLAVWGAPEGAFIMLPLLGPSNERDAIGEIVDLASNPMSTLLSADSNQIGTGVRITNVIGERGEIRDTIDDVLYGSVDSYSQLRVIGQQTRRFELGEDTVDTAEDADPFALDTEGF